MKKGDTVKVADEVDVERYDEYGPGFPREMKEYFGQVGEVRYVDEFDAAVEFENGDRYWWLIEDLEVIEED